MATSRVLDKGDMGYRLHVSALKIIVLSPYSTGEMAPAIAAARSGAVGLLDLQYSALTGAGAEADLAEVFSHLEKHSRDGSIGVRCQSGRLIDLKKLDPEAGSKGSGRWIILTAGAGSFDKARLRADVDAARAAGWLPLVEAINLEEATTAAACGAAGVIAKGHEGAGRVGDTTTFVLVQQFVENLTLPVWAQGGIGLHSAAAIAAAGGAGIVLDSQLSLCRDAATTPQNRLRIEKMDGSETTLVHGPAGETFRLVGSTATWADVQNLLDGKGLENKGLENKGTDHLLIGQDGCFAALLAKVGGTVSGALAAIRESVGEQLAAASKCAALAEGSPLAQSHRTRFPIVQGAMTRVSDTSDFALSVAEGGALPFLALSLMRGPEIEKLLTETREKLGNLSWGVGLLGFVPQALRQEQMAVVDKFKPPFAMIAGGRPDQAKAMEDDGTPTYLHVPSPLLLKSFVEMGSRRFIFEGKECGGHVGPRTSFVLWQSMVEVLLDAIGPREDVSGYHIIFAGGIHDARSAAMVATLAAPLSARGIKCGFLIGTAYLFTEEAVSTGAIVEKFQQAALACNETVLLETGPGHSIRCIDSPYKQVFSDLRAKLEKEEKSRDDIREELELLNLGRLRIASKGLTKGNSAQNPLVEIPVEQQWQEGMYMIGQVAAMHSEKTTIAKLHHAVSADGQNLLTLRHIEESLDSAPSEKEAEGIAIVGMSCQFPQGNDVETFWRNILGKVDSIEEIPATHFDWRNYYDPDPQARDKIISKWGGFLPDVIFDPSVYGIPPSSLDSIDPMQVLILEAAKGALNDAGYNQRKFVRAKTSVILANAGHGPITALYSLRSMLGWKLDGLGDETTEAIKSDIPEWTEDSFAGYLGNVAAGRVANRLDLKGINFSIDAACASSLAALYVSMADLRSGASDVVLLGATDTHNQPGDYLSFSKTYALSPTGRCKTFDAKADGIAISEGIAMLVLKRLSDAERDGDRIYAVIRGIGGSSDGRDLSLTAPRPAGQMLALERAYADASCSPSSVQIVEAHGTGTVAGDKAEVEALTRVFQADGATQGSCAIGSVKTNIGHTKAAAGLASIVKIAKALHHKVLPPTINVSEPNPACNFGEGPFYINSECRPWIAPRDGQPRRGGISAFGFGGTNFHTVLEEYVPPCPMPESSTLEAWPAELFLWKANSAADLVKALGVMEASIAKVRADYAVESNSTSQERRRLFDLASKLHLKNNDGRLAGASLAIVATSIDELEKKIGEAKKVIVENPVRSSNMIRGLHFQVNAAGAGRPKVAFLFPGQGSQKLDMLSDLNLFFPEIRRTVEYADQSLHGRSLLTGLAGYIYPSPSVGQGQQERRDLQQAKLTATNIAQPALGACDLAVNNLLTAFGVRPDMTAGHSYGEYVALYAGGVINADELLYLSAERGRILASCAEENPGAMAAVSSGLDALKRLVDNGLLAGVSLANINSPTQCIISGSVDAIEAAIVTLKEKDIAAKRINVSAAFHSPLMADSKAPLEAALKQVKFAQPTVPVYSNTTAKPYQNVDQSSIVAQLSEHALNPVYFANQLQAMHDDGARIFVEVGPGSVLTGLAEATLKGRDFTALNCERAGKNSLEHFLNVLASLAVSGVAIDLSRLYLDRLFALREKLAAPIAAGGKKLLYKVNSAMIERLGAPPKVKATLKTVRNPNGQQSMDSNNKKSIPPMSSSGGRADRDVDKVMLEFQQTMLDMTNRFLETQQNVMMAYLQTRQGNLPAEFLQNNAMPQMQMPQIPQMQMPVPQTPVPQATNNGAYAQTVKPSAPVPAQPVAGPVAGPVAAPAAVAAAVAVPTPAASGAIDPDALIESLYEIVSDRTGYPREMLNPELDLEADMGIDSIKRVEILNNFRKLLPEETQTKLESGIEKLAGTKTLQGIIDWIRSLNDLEDEAVSVTAVTTAAPQVSSAQLKSTNGNGKVSEPVAAAVAASVNSASAIAPRLEGNIDNVARGVVVVEDLPPAGQTTKAIAGVTLIIADSAEVSFAVASAVESRGGKTALYSAEQIFADEKSLSDAIAKVRAEHKTVGSVINICQPTDTKADSNPEWSRLTGTFLLAKELQNDLLTAANAGQRAGFVNATYLGGDFGGVLEDGQLPLAVVAEQAGIVGLTKTIAKEMPGVYVKIVDLNSALSPQEVANAVVTELMADDDIVEIGIAAGQRIGLQVADSPFAKLPPVQKPLIDKSSVILVTGGARGITAKIITELARKYQPTFIIAGRLPKPKDAESPTTVGKTALKDLKAQIIDDMRKRGVTISVREIEKAYQQLLREREVRSTLKELEALGATVKYYAVDVTDAVAFGQLLGNIYETSTIDGIIHGAGVIEDALIKDKTVDSFHRVFNTKVQSALTLAQNVNFDALKFMFFFSSVVGRTGNSGQADYVSANEAVNKLALILQQRTKARVASLMWGPWQAGMAPPELEAVFASHGWSMIQGEDGRDCFHEELLRESGDQVEVLLVGRLTKKDGNGQAAPAQHLEPVRSVPAAATDGLAPVSPAPVNGNGNGNRNTNGNGKRTLVDGPLSGRVFKSEMTGVFLNQATLHSQDTPDMTEERSYLLPIDTSQHLYLNDHKFDGIPVMPMAVALEIMVEAARSVFPRHHLLQVSDLDIPAGIVFQSTQKDFVLEVQMDPIAERTVSVQLTSATPKKAHFRCKVAFGAERAVAPPVVTTALESSVPSEFDPAVVTEPTNDLPQPEDVYGKWLFHGPIFQGISRVLMLENEEVIGLVAGALPGDCVTTADGSPWLVDPVLLDSSMQLAGIWARHFQDVTVLPTGFKRLRIFKPVGMGQATARIFLNESNAMNLLCDLAIYNEDRELAILVEGLGGIASKAFNRFSSASSQVPEIAR